MYFANLLFITDVQGFWELLVGLREMIIYI